MEIAITIPQDLSEQAEELACQLGISRNELFTTALKRFVETRAESEITRKLNELYAQEDSSLDPALMQMQLSTLDAEAW